MATYYFHAAVHAARYELVFLDVGPVHAVHLMGVFMPGTDGVCLYHLSHLLSPALG
jgi:hypothetical protein